MTISYRIDLKYDEIPVDMRVESEERRQELIEHVSNVDDTLGELFLGIFLFNQKKNIYKPSIISRRGESSDRN